MRKKVYLAGPMRGYQQWNFPAFDAAQEKWEAAGWHVFSPAAVCRALGYAHFDEAKATSDCKQEGVPHLQHVMLSDIACIYQADAIALLPNWQHSKGAAVEVMLGLFLGLPFYCANTMLRLSIAYSFYDSIQSELEEAMLNYRIAK